MEPPVPRKSRLADDAKRTDPSQIPPETEVIGEQADLGDADVRKPVVKGVVPHPQTGEPALDVEKGAPFKKEIIVPADRITRVEGDRVVVDIDKQEVEDLSAFG